METAAISVTLQGDEIAGRLKEKGLDIHLFSKCQMDDFNLKRATEEAFKEYKQIVFIASTGIAARAIAPFIKSKDADPAVVVVDASGKFAISLLSGHLGGANQLAEEIAGMLKAQPVITTATDTIGVVAPDVIAKKYGLVIDDLKSAKHMAALLVKGEKVAFEDEQGEIPLPEGYVDEATEASGIVKVTSKAKHPGSNELKLVRKNIVLGIGCRKDFDSLSMRENVLQVLQDMDIDKRAVRSICTVSVKKDEKCIRELAEFLNCSLNIYSVEEIREIQDEFQGSSFVEKTIGVKAVCEPCVVLGGAQVIQKKMKLNGMTLSIGKS